MVDAFPKSLRKKFQFQFSVAHMGRGKKLRPLKGRQEKLFHARQDCPACRKGLPHTHIYRYTGESTGKYTQGRLYGEKYYFPKGSRTLKGKVVSPPRR